MILIENLMNIKLNEINNNNNNENNNNNNDSNNEINNNNNKDDNNNNNNNEINNNNNNNIDNNNNNNNNEEQEELSRSLTAQKLHNINLVFRFLTSKYPELPPTITPLGNKFSINFL